ncbi:hypothetical protein AB0L49_45605 [Streptomyces antimycoticus]|uniref:hypothetical protein n=1 Tax=Streptomyces antimycoticus TaxID=68175 RepID=UPI00343C8632
MLGDISPPELIDDGGIVLSAGQHEVLCGLAGGQDLGWITANSGIGTDEIRRDVRELMALVHAKTLAHLVHRGWELGLLGPALDEAFSRPTIMGPG